MKINIRGKNKLEITPALRAYAEEKVGKLAGLFNPRHEITAHVLCKVYDSHHAVEVTIPTKHLILRAESEADTMYAAIDLVVDKLERQTQKIQKPYQFYCQETRRYRQLLQRTIQFSGRPETGLKSARQKQRNRTDQNERGRSYFADGIIGP